MIIISKIKEDIQGAQLSVADKTLLEYELDCKQSDRFSDKSSLFEYSELLTILGRGFVKKSDYSQLSLLMDPEVEYMVDEKKIRERLNENHRLFRKIDQVMKHGTIPDDLEKELKHYLSDMKMSFWRKLPVKCHFCL